MAEIRTHEQVVGIVCTLAMEANNDAEHGREEYSTQTRNAMRWLEATDAALRSELAAAERDRDAMQASALNMRDERDAYRKAKAENDERFMGERDVARQERDAARADRDEFRRERDALAAKLAESERKLARIREWCGGLGWLGSPQDERVEAECLSILAAAKPPAPALPRYTRVIHTTAGDTWQTSEDGILWRDTPRVYFGDGSLGSILASPAPVAKDKP